MRYSPWIYRAPSIGWGFFILYACLAPADNLDPGWNIEISDKLVHFVLYAFLGMVVARALAWEEYYHHLKKRWYLYFAIILPFDIADIMR